VGNYWVVRLTTGASKDGWHNWRGWAHSAARVDSFSRSAVALSHADRQMPRPGRWPTPTTIIIASIGATLVAAALVFDARWFDRHFLPSFFLPRRWYEWIPNTGRWTMAVVGASVPICSRWIAARLTPRVEGRCAGAA